MPNFFNKIKNMLSPERKSKQRPSPERNESMKEQFDMSYDPELTIQEIESYECILTTLIFIVSETANEIFICADQLLRHMTKYFDGNNFLINAGLHELAPFIKVYKLCEKLKKMLIKARSESDVLSGNEEFFSMFQSITKTLDEYYKVREEHMTMPPPQLPIGNLEIRYWLKRLTEIPYLMHRDMFCQLNRFLDWYELPWIHMQEFAECKFFCLIVFINMLISLGLQNIFDENSIRCYWEFE
ncbi:hypothetical protein ACOME3_001724 [Neoechinorhynchus agilis]